MIALAIFVVVSFLAKVQADSVQLPMPDCNRCGNFTIPFPFGTTTDCILNDSFLITCNYSFDPPKPFLNSGTIEVLDISLDGTMRVASSVAANCYDKSGALTKSEASKFTSSKFPISSTQNKFTTVGCDTYAIMKSSEELKQMTGCMSSCNSIESVVVGTCSGIGCCQSSIPKGEKDFLVDIHSFRNHTGVHQFNPCGYAFVVESEAFQFSSADLVGFLHKKIVPVVLDWSIGHGGCQETHSNSSNYACKANSQCLDSITGQGYLCKCNTGFQGNPYLKDGCQDIDECVASNPCHGTCTNFPAGSYTCSCPEGFEGDGKKEGTGCQSKSETNGSTLFYLASGLMVPALGGSWIFWKRKQKKVTNLRQSLYERNGGRILENMLRRHRTLEIFTPDDLKMATGNYEEDNILWREHPFESSYYKGILPDGENTLVTIKRCPLDRCDTKSFIHKLVTLSRVNHRNVVRLLGCCLETRDPMLVYEFMPMETLYDYINHGVLQWDMRLRIASDIAKALAYLHCSASQPIIHGNLDSSSIILDEDLNVKLHDFGLVTSSHPSFYFSWDTSGCLDTQCPCLGKLTVKSDVHSFGLILAELLARQDRLYEAGLLSQKFMCCNTEDDLISLMDIRLLSGLASKTEHQQVIEVAKLARKCLSRSSTDRPTMDEVVFSLESCRNMNSNPTEISSNLTLRKVVRRNSSF